MRRGATTMRLVAGLALAFALAAALAPFAGPRALAQENGQASITIYTAICPAGFDPDQLFEQCYDNPGAGIDYFLLEPGSSETIVATSGANGLTAFEGLTVEGEYSLQVQYPLNLIAVRCSEDGNPFPFAFSEIVNQILLDLTTDNDIRCDFYLPSEEPGPATAQLTIHNRVCPVEYAGTNFFADCHGNPADGQEFFLEDGVSLQGTTDAAGDVTFSGLAPDTYFVFGGPPGEFIERTAIFCAPAAAPGTPFPFAQDDGEAAFTITLGAGDDVICDFYSIPEDLRGETPTPAPTVAPTQPPAQPTATVSTLPSTGAGTDVAQGGAVWPLAGLLALVVVGAAAATARGRLARAEVRARR